MKRSITKFPKDSHKLTRKDKEIFIKNNLKKKMFIFIKKKKKKSLAGVM